MSEKQHFSERGILGAIGSERQTRGKTDPEILSKTLVKSPAWKKNAFRRQDSGGDGDNTFSHLRSTLAQQSEKIEHLRAAIARLKAENAGLVDQHERELAELQAAYDQFEQLSDELLAELDQKNSRLLSEIREQNPRSIL